MSRSSARLSPASLCITAFAALTLSLLPATASHAKERASSQSKAAKKQSGQVKIKHIRSSSEESPAQRDRRLYRECQGRPNSGACAGYTQRPPSKQ